MAGLAKPNQTESWQAEGDNKKLLSLNRFPETIETHSPLIIAEAGFFKDPAISRGFQ